MPFLEVTAASGGAERRPSHELLILQHSRQGAAAAPRSVQA
jgi:hypothetical protein